MTPIVKTFIEKYMYLVEEKQYSCLFDIWYTMYANKFSTTAEANNALIELFRIFNSAGFDLKSKSEEARRALLKERLSDVIKAYSYVGAKSITFATACNKLNTMLGFGPIESRDIFLECGKELGFKTTNNIVHFEDIT